MTKKWILATFECNVVDDPEFSDGGNGDIVVPGGGNITRILMEKMDIQGFSIEGPFERDYYGWEFIAKKESKKYLLLLQFVDDWLLTAQDITGFIDRFKKSQVSLRGTLTELNHALAEDRRFGRVRWFTAAEYEENGPGREAP